MGDNRRGWSSAGLKALGDDPQWWSAEEASKLLGPPQLSPAQVRGLIRCAGLEPVGKRRVSGKGRHARVYRAAELIRLFDAVYTASGGDLT